MSQRNTIYHEASIIQGTSRKTEQIDLVKNEIYELRNVKLKLRPVHVPNLEHKTHNWDTSRIPPTFQLPPPTKKTSRFD